MSEPSTIQLRELVAGQIEARWEVWAEAHPNLARVIDRTALIESAVSSLREDPGFAEAMAGAEGDALKMQSAARLVELAEKVIARLMAV